MSEIDPEDLGRALGAVPLFRELQRLLASQAGPVNWEIAGQIARAVAQAGSEQAKPSADDIDALETACRAAELRVSELTGLDPTVTTETRVLDRVEWAEINLNNFAPLVDRLATRLGQTQAPESPVSLSFLNTLGPFLLGVQVGFLVGYLSRRVLGQYDLCYPAGDHGKLYFIHPNIVEVEQELGFDSQEFGMWLALHEVTHQLEFQSVAWTRSHFIELIERYIDGAEVDSSEVAERLRGLSDPEQLDHLLKHPEELLPMLMSPVQQQILGEIQAFMSVLEGYAEWTMNAVGKQLLSEFDKMREGMNRRRAERSPGERMLEQLLGLDLKREQYRAGEKFVTAVAEADQMKLLWEGPGNLPTLEEVAQPAKWLSRVAFS